MTEFKMIFLSLLLLSAAFADEEAPEPEEPAPEAVESEVPTTIREVFSLALARAEGVELSTVELLVDAYINLLDIMSNDDGQPDKYDEEDVLRQYSEYDNPYVKDVIKAFEDDAPEEEGSQEVERLSRVVEEHFKAQGFEPEEHRSLLNQHELYPKLSQRLAPPYEAYIRQVQEALLARQQQQQQQQQGHLGDEL